MIQRSCVLAIALLSSMGSPGLSQSHDHSSSETPYAGFETRQIKSLSDDDIAQIRAGAGWGLALPAELNGLPGPLHVLELQSELALSDEQIAEVSAVYEAMKADAIAAGERFIEAERALSMAFQQPALSEEALKVLLEAAGQARAALRYVHLSRHLETARLLSADQIRMYNQLRGYSADPCASVPEGHDAAMWRKHNNCG